MTTGASSSMVDYYARRASEYERIYHKPERQADLRLLEEQIGLIFKNKSVLEIACGTGYWTAILAQSAASVIAIDINAEVLEIAESKLAGQSQVRFVREDVYQISKLKGDFTGGLAAFWWSHIPKQTIRTFLLEFHKALNPGATVVFLDNRYVSGSSTPISHVDDEGNSYQTRKLDNGNTFEVLKNFPSEQELKAAVQGYAREVQIRQFPYFWMLIYELK